MPRKYIPYLFWFCCLLIFTVKCFAQGVNNFLEQDKPDSIVHFAWDNSDQALMYFAKTTFGYSTNGNKVEEYNSNYVGSVWQNLTKTIYSFSDNKLDKENLLYWDDYSMDWINQWQFSYAYNEQNLLLEQSKIYWNESISEWQNDSLFKFSYNNSAELIGTIKQSWSNSIGWENAFRKYKYCVEQPSVCYDNKAYWDFDVLLWEDYYKQEIYVDDEGKTTQIIIERIPMNNSQWQKEQKIVFSYNSMDSVVVQTAFAWLNNEEQWIEDYKWNFIYGSSGKIIYKEKERFDWELYTYEKFFKQVIEYDEYHRIELVSDYNYANNGWNISQQYKCYYSEPVSIKKGNNAESLKVYPNPANSMVCISSAKEPMQSIKVYSTNGTLIKQEYFSKSTFDYTFSIPENYYGFFLMHIQTKSTLECIKLVIQ